MWGNYWCTMKAFGLWALSQRNQATSFNWQIYFHPRKDQQSGRCPVVSRGYATLNAIKSLGRQSGFVYIILDSIGKRRFIMKLCDGCILCYVKWWPSSASEAESLADVQVLGNANHVYFHPETPGLKQRILISSYMTRWLQRIEMIQKA